MSIFSQISSVILRHVYGWETVVLSLPKMELKTCCSTMHVGADYLWLQLLRYVNGKHISKEKLTSMIAAEKGSYDILSDF